MSESLVLSSIFVGIIVLSGFAGASLGIARGFAATAAIFLGSELALWWGDDLGDRIERIGGTSQETGRFLSGMLVLLLTVLIVGLSGSMVLRWGTPARWGAFLGVLLGAANGALLIAIALRLYYLAYAGKVVSLPLDDSIVTRVLWRNFDWYLLGFAAVSAVLLLYTRMMRLPIAIPDPSTRVSFSRPIPPPLSRSIPETARDRFAIDPVSDGRLSNGFATNPPAEEIDDAVYAPPRTHASEQPAGRERPMSAVVQEPRTELPSTRNTVRFCPNCGMTLDLSDRFCPDCGFTL